MPADPHPAQAVIELIMQGGPTALLTLFILALLRGDIVTKGHHQELVKQLEDRLKEGLTREIAGEKRESELLDLAFTGANLAEQAAESRRRKPT
jgi:hypothetical protein